MLELTLTILNKSQPIDVASSGAHAQFEDLYIAAVGATDLAPLASVTSIKIPYTRDDISSRARSPIGPWEPRPTCASLCRPPFGEP